MNRLEILEALAPFARTKAFRVFFRPTPADYARARAAYLALSREVQTEPKP